jgi:hypothetical protein
MKAKAHLFTLAYARLASAHLENISGHVVVSVKTRGVKQELTARQRAAAQKGGGSSSREGMGMGKGRCCCCTLTLFYISPIFYSPFLLVFLVEFE